MSLLVKVQTAKNALPPTLKTTLPHSQDILPLPSGRNL